MGETAWHYTDVTAFEGVLETGVLWATSSHGLNDPFEVEYGVSEVLRGWRELRPDLRSDAPASDVDDWLESIAARTRERDIYFVSASGRGDSLANWQAYAGSDGLAIEFDPSSEFRLSCCGEPCEYYTPDAVPPIFWRRVDYGHTDYNWGPSRDDPILRLIHYALDSFALLAQGRAIDLPLFHAHLEHAFLNVVCHYKDPAYEHEDEFRLAVIVPPASSFRRERVGRYGPQGYVHLGPADPDDLDRHCVRTLIQLPIARVRLGPTAPNDLESRVRQGLDDAGMHEVTVDASTVPYR